MPWTNPTTRSTGDLITAAIWNTDLVDNLRFVHDRVVERLQAVLNPTAAYLGNATYASQANNTDIPGLGPQYFRFTAPGDLGSLVAAEVLVMGSATGAYEYDAHAEYGALGEAYTAHVASALNQSHAMTANQLSALSVSSLLASLAAGDIVNVRVGMSAGVLSASWYFLGLRLRYSRL